MPNPFSGPVSMGPSAGMPPIGTLIIIVVVCGIGYQLLRWLFQTTQNLSESEVERPARVVARRQQTTMSGGTQNMPAHAHTHYYVTFEFGDGNREEFSVAAGEFGMLVEGDEGVLRSRGTWYRGFDRQPQPR